MPNFSVVDSYNALVDDADKLAKNLSARIPTFLEAEEFETVRLLASSAQKFKEFRRRLERLKNISAQRTSVATQPSWHFQERHSAGTVTARASRTRLRVTLSDGRTIEEATAAATFALVIQKFGLERVAQVGWRANNEPLVSQVPSPDYDQIQLGRWYVMTHSNTKYKQRVLNGLAEELGVVIRADIVY